MKLSCLTDGYDVVLNGLKDLNEDVRGIEFDSRKIKEGFMFVAIVGYKTDGHRFIDSAVDRGAKVVVHQRELEEYRNDITYVRCENTRNALAYFAGRFYENPSSDIKLIGISGTNGKTSFCDMAVSLFDALGKKTDYIGTLGRKNTVLEGQIIRTTPEITELNSDFRQMADEDTDYCFLEVSSHGLVLDRVSYLDFYVAVFSNLSQDHLDFHKTMEEYYQAKKKLYYMAREYCLINTDDRWGKRLYTELRADGVKAYSFGENSDADYRLAVRDMSLKGSSFDIVHEGKTCSFKINTIGKFNIFNTLPAAIIALREGFPEKDIRKALLKHTGTNGRMERVTDDAFIDYAHSPDAMENVLKLLKEASDRKIVCIFGCGGDRDRDKRPKMGRMAEKYADRIVITMDNPRSENNDDIMDEILKGIEDRSKVSVISDRSTAIRENVINRKDDEVIIVLGKGHETYQEIGNEKFYFSDRDEILKASEA